MKYTVYKTTNILDGKIYIGKHQTINPDDLYLGSGKDINNAITKYGRENFTKEILFIFDNEQDMDNKEAELVTEEFCKDYSNYNLCPGGKGGWGYTNQNGFNNSKLQREKAKLNITKRNKSPEAKLLSSKILKELNNSGLMKSTGFTNKIHTQETKLRMSISHKDKHSGDKNSQFGSMWITNGLDNKKIKKSDIIPEGWNKGRKMK